MLGDRKQSIYFDVLEGKDSPCLCCMELTTRNLVQRTARGPGEGQHDGFKRKGRKNTCKHSSCPPWSHHLAVIVMANNDSPGHFGLDKSYEALRGMYTDLERIYVPFGVTVIWPTRIARLQLTLPLISSQLERSFKDPEARRSVRENPSSTTTRVTSVFPWNSII
jgi:hypothetical protein